MSYYSKSKQAKKKHILIYNRILQVVKIVIEVFIQIKFCVLGGEEQNFILNNKYDQLLSFLRYNFYLRVNCKVLLKLFT